MKVITHLGMGSTQPGEIVDLEEGEAKRLLRLGAASLPGSAKKSSARDEQDQAEKADTTSKSDKNKE